jgi:hypothetical protein
MSSSIRAKFEECRAVPQQKRSARVTDRRFRAKNTRFLARFGGLLGSFHNMSAGWRGTRMPSGALQSAECIPSDGAARGERPRMTLPFLSAERALIFRITHRDNLAWILDNGIHARSSQVQDPNFRKTGDFDLIEKRPRRNVPVGPLGTLSDYIPFYFTPHSMMAYNIHTGYRGIERVLNRDLVILCTSLPRLSAPGVPFVFTDEHAYRATARYFTDVVDLKAIDWPILQNHDFKHDPDDPGKTDRYQAEALIHKYLQLDALLEICGCDIGIQQQIENELTKRGLTVKACAEEGWYF